MLGESEGEGEGEGDYQEYACLGLTVNVNTKRQIHSCAPVTFYLADVIMHMCKKTLTSILLKQSSVSASTLSQSMKNAECANADLNQLGGLRLHQICCTPSPCIRPQDRK